MGGSDDLQDKAGYAPNGDLGMCEMSAESSDPSAVRQVEFKLSHISSRSSPQTTAALDGVLALLPSRKFGLRRPLQNQRERLGRPRFDRNSFSNFFSGVTRSASTSARRTPQASKQAERMEFGHSLQGRTRAPGGDNPYCCVQPGYLRITTLA
jgi:hypothetical protein